MTNEETGGEATELLGVLGDDTRRAIIDRLARGSSSVQRLADDLPVGRSAVSQHLRILKDAGLVSDRADGTRRIYSIEPSGFEVLRAYMERVWAAGLAAYEAAAEEQATAGSSSPGLDDPPDDPPNQELEP